MLCWLTSCPGLTLLPVQAWHHLHMNRVSTLKGAGIVQEAAPPQQKQSFAPPREPSRTHAVCALRTQTQRRARAHARPQSDLGSDSNSLLSFLASSKDILGNRRMTNLGTIKPSKQMSERAHTDTRARTHGHTVAGTGDQSIFLVMAS